MLREISGLYDRGFRTTPVMRHSSITGSISSFFLSIQYTPCLLHMNTKAITVTATIKGIMTAAAITPALGLLYRLASGFSFRPREEEKKSTLLHNIILNWFN